MWNSNKKSNSKLPFFIDSECYQEPPPPPPEPPPENPPPEDDELEGLDVIDVWAVVIVELINVEKLCTSNADGLSYQVGSWSEIASNFLIHLSDTPKT